MSIDESRFFPNPAFSNNNDARKEKEDVTKLCKERWTPEHCTLVSEQLLHKCLDFHETKDEGSSSSSSMGTLYTGALGARVYLRLRMVQHLKTMHGDEDDQKKTTTSIQPKVDQLLKEALRLAQEAVTIETDGLKTHHRRAVRVSLLEGPLVGAHAMLVAALYESNQCGKAKIAATNLLTLLDEHCSHLSSSECEILYGRAGALQVILFLRLVLQDETYGSTLAVRLGQEIIEEGIRNQNLFKQTYSSTKPIPQIPLWQWHNKFYLGAAHGAVGIYYTLLSLQSSELAQIKQNTTFDLEGQFCSFIIPGLDTLCWPTSGNLRSSLESQSSKDRLVHWCHGSPGHVLLLVKASKELQNQDLLKRAQTIGEQVIWPRGLLHKGVGLCHGISGNAYSMLALAGTNNKMSNNVWFQRAIYFADFAWQHFVDQLEDVPDRPYSLFEGAGGLALLLMDLGEKQKYGSVKNMFPCYF